MSKADTIRERIRVKNAQIDEKTESISAIRKQIKKLKKELKEAQEELRKVEAEEVLEVADKAGLSPAEVVLAIKSGKIQPEQTAPAE